MIRRVAYIEHCTPPFFDVAQRLRDELGWEPVYWVAAPSVGAIVGPRFPDMIFHSRYDANDLVSPPALRHVTIEPLDEPYLQSMAQVELVVLKMLDVFDSLDAFAFDERARFFRQRLRYWRSIVRALDVDLVLFPFSPHTVYDYIIQEICVRDGIRTVMFENPYPLDWATFFTMDSPHSGPVALRQQLSRIPADEPGPLSPAFEKYLQKTRGSYADALPWYMRDQLADFPDDLAKNVFAPDVQRTDDEPAPWWQRLTRGRGRGGRV